MALRAAARCRRRSQCIQDKLLSGGVLFVVDGASYDKAGFKHMAGRPWQKLVERAQFPSGPSFYDASF